MPTVLCWRSFHSSMTSFLSHITMVTDRFFSYWSTSSTQTLLCPLVFLSGGVFIVHSDSSSILVIQRHVPLYYSFDYTTGVNCRQPFCFWCPSSVRSDRIVWTVIRKHLIPAPQWRFLCVNRKHLIQDRPPSESFCVWLENTSSRPPHFFGQIFNHLFIFWDVLCFLWECDKNKRE